MSISLMKVSVSIYIDFKLSIFYFLRKQGTGQKLKAEKQSKCLKEVSFYALGLILILSTFHQHNSISQIYITVLMEMKMI